MNWKELIRQDDVAKLLANWNEQQPLKGTGREKDYPPVVKLFNPIGNGTWLVTEANEDGLAFGLADLGSPEMGYFDLQEIADVRLFGGTAFVEQDTAFEGTKPLSEYAADARRAGYITA